MATSTAMSGVYIQVIEDVINNVRNDFLDNGGPGHDVLLQLQGLWEAKLMQVGGGVITPAYDLNVPYEDYETPTTDLLFPPTPVQTSLPGLGQTPFPGTTQTPGTADLCNMPIGGTPFTPADYPSDNSQVPEMKPGRPSQFMEPPAPWLNQRPPLDVNVAYDESHKEVRTGASHEPTTQDFFTMSSGKRKRDALTSQYIINGYIPQQDGSGDAVSDESKSHVTQNYVFDDNDEDADDEPLNENDDDLDDVDHEEDLNTKHFVLAQFDQVAHPGGRCKCTLKDGIMHINNKDILFKKATGQFDFSKKKL